MNKWRRFWRLSGLERGVLLRALLLLPLTTVALRLLGFRRWQATLARLAPVAETAGAGLSEASIERAQCVARMVQAASREGPSRGNCLERSVVLWWLLRRQGIAGELRIGARKQAGRFEAHAWVEFAGGVLNDAEDVHQQYAPFGRSIDSGEVKSS